MSVFKDHERTVVRMLVAPHMPEDQLEALIATATVASYDHTGVGYFLTVRHQGVPTERVVCSSPVVIGKTDAVVCGWCFHHRLLRTERNPSGCAA